MKSSMMGSLAFKVGGFHALALLVSAICISTNAQSIPGFLSIDCGSDVTTYNDAKTTIPWVNDDLYVSTGTNANVPLQVNSTLDNYQALNSFRYFPERRSKHCYELPTTSQISFLIRAMFLHANSSELVLPIEFSVSINATTWFSVQYGTGDSSKVLSTPQVFEAFFYSPGNVTHLCLVPVAGVPFISSLEVRQLDPDGNMYSFYSEVDYETKDYYLKNLFRYNSGAEVGTSAVRFPDDQFDRLWYAPGEWASGIPVVSGIATDNATSSDVNNVPSNVMQDAWASNTANSSFNVSLYNFDSSYEESEFLTELYVAVYVKDTYRNASRGSIFRGFDLILDGYFTDSYSINATNDTDLEWDSLSLWNDSLTLEFAALPWSTFGPIVNAIEIYSRSDFANSQTTSQDVEALKDLKESFTLTDWQGDPCYPVAWDWVACDYNDTSSVRVTKLLLSSMGIHGTIPTDILRLDALTEIHLDNNSLSGEIPDSLGYLDNLVVLLLNDNNLTGEVPPNLQGKPGLLFKYYDNRLEGQLSPVPAPSGPATSGPATKKSPATKKKSTGIGVIIGAIGGGIVVLGSVLCTLKRYFCPRKTDRNDPPKIIPAPPDSEEDPIFIPQPSRPAEPRPPVQPIQRPHRIAAYVTHEEVRAATDDFKQKIGRGSYGDVYHGWLNGTEVAVKVNSFQSNQGHDEFITEVGILTRVHHKNLVSLVGYCDDENELILIYVYQANGTLREWLYSEETRPARGTLNWAKRLQIAAEAATGLDYLHNGCCPSIIHRDVKSSNILLDAHQMAKVADFGLCKSIPTNSVPSKNSTGYSTTVMGTWGYLDPEYQELQRLTHKSDVYSFGVVLAELITGQPPFEISKDGKTFILINWLKKFHRDNMEAFVDQKLNNFERQSMLRVVEIALCCVERESARRPHIKQVVQGLAEAATLNNGTTSTTSSYKSCSSFATERSGPSLNMRSSNPHCYQNLR